ncbi:MAG: translation initiation factor IF-2 [Chloroflexi bacterium]|jgi:translation initiation factor IF-2|nr:translation initiation factor IF-2 [Anaerolineaceae bacterium]NLI44037.1 translation initiation factor IF-2 [Chloroflexota bacterium]HOE34241.1 translation initiation factor IF-2 [Anaerolineaceae bacterium]HOT25814.1 translation initiation factor IF-2 [Anaerolineaceae bacterium]HQH58225.1 translation initiation factor IF-2 [Anaerolineaceae bacterium]
MSNDGKKEITLPFNLSVRDLAAQLNASPVQVIKILMSNGVMASINQQVDFDTAAVVASELGFTPQLQKEEVKVEETGEIPLWRRVIMDEDPTKLENRPPVITILGHVDHGKTTLLDAVRHTNVAGGEAGGITQHIGAYQVTHKNRLITFLDTPGHAAFSSMRARGAKGADIVILVVAADDGVQPQTKEAVNHAKAAQVPIVVALNKIDKPDANPDLVKRQLAEIGLQPDEWEGDTFVVPVSAKTRKGLDDLLETILLVADNMVIKANPKGACIGTVVEAKLDKTTGPMATLLVQNGTLKVGNVIVAGESYGKIKAMFDQRHKRIDKAGPSTPVMVMGLDHLPDAGDLFQVVENEREARQIVEGRKAERESRRSLKRATLEELFAKVKSGETKELRLILKADVRGSLEPIVNSLEDLGKKEKDISIQVLHSETGNITESDVALAAASNAVILGFNVDVDQNTKHLAEAEGVSIRVYKIIYRLLEDVEKALKGLLEPEMVEKVIGTAQVLATFKVSKAGMAAGCRVLDGEIRRNASVRVVRAGEVVFTGEISSLKREKEDVRDVREGMECGISIKNFEAFEIGDIIESFVMEKFGG